MQGVTRIMTGKSDACTNDVAGCYEWRNFVKRRFLNREQRVQCMYTVEQNAAFVVMMTRTADFLKAGV